MGKVAEQAELSLLPDEKVGKTFPTNILEAPWCQIYLTIRATILCLHLNRLELTHEYWECYNMDIIVT